MPQMMPLNWLTLMMFFIISFFLFNNLNFYNFFNTPKKLTNMKKNIKMIWKW